MRPFSLTRIGTAPPALTSPAPLSPTDTGEEPRTDSAVAVLVVLCTLSPLPRGGGKGGGGRGAGGEGSGGGKAPGRLPLPTSVTITTSREGRRSCTPSISTTTPPRRSTAKCARP